ncbi:MAG: hypothetical protein ABF289_20780 [Clostridiales bacterium]
MNKNNRSLKQTYLTSLSQLSDSISCRIDTYMENANSDINKLDELLKLILDNNIDNKTTAFTCQYKEDVFSTIESLKGQIKNISRLKQYLKYKTEINRKPKNEFKIGDVLNRIKLLTKEELEDNFCTLESKLKISAETKIRGRATSLVQVLLIHIINACHAYNKCKGRIYLIISQDENNTIIQIHDNAEKSSDFHESFIKTDIYMSYMIVKNEFDGIVWFESEETGTSFFVSFPT